MTREELIIAALREELSARDYKIAQLRAELTLEAQSRQEAEQKAKELEELTGDQKSDEGVSPS